MKFPYREGVGVRHRRNTAAAVKQKFDCRSFCVSRQSSTLLLKKYSTMALQALAPYYKDSTLHGHDHATVLETVNTALTSLVNRQNAEHGGFSYETEGFTSESSAQVLVALTALDVNSPTRESTLEGLLRYGLSNGAFQHTQVSGENQMATEQAAYALASYSRYQNRQTSLYDMSDAFIIPVTTITTATLTGIVEPVAGAVPIELSALETTDTGYSITSITWNGLSGNFDYDTVYMASVVLTADSGYKFSAITPTVNVGTASAGTVNSDTEGNTLTFTITFSATETKPLKTVLVGTQSDRVITGTGGAVTYSVTTTNIANGTYTATLNEAPSGVTASDITITDNSGTLTLTVGNAVAKNTYPLTLTIDGTTSDNFVLTVSPIPTHNVTINGGTGSGSDTSDSGDTEAESKPRSESNSAVTEVKPKVEDGAAVAELKTDAAKELIEEAKTKEYANITVSVSETDNVSRVELNFASESISGFADSGLNLTVQSPSATITFGTDTLKAIAEGCADGETVRITASTVSQNELNPKQQATVGNNPVIDLTVWAGNTQIRDLKGEVTVSVPYTPPAGMTTTDYDLLTVYYLDDGGNIHEMKDAKYNAATGEIIFTTNHFSVFFVSEWSSPFSDVGKNAWYYKAVRFAYSESLMTGTDDFHFSPDLSLTRAMLVTLLYRCEGEPSVNARVAFTDVELNKWYTNAVIWANANGIVEGYGNGLFGTNDNVTREQIATILLRYAEKKGMNTSGKSDLTSYLDAPQINNWASEAMKWANAEQFITGRTEKTLAPQGTATRAEAATIIMRFTEKLGA